MTRLVSTVNNTQVNPISQMHTHSDKEREKGMGEGRGKEREGKQTERERESESERQREWGEHMHTCKQANSLPPILISSWLSEVLLNRIYFPGC